MSKIYQAIALLLAVAAPVAAAPNNILLIIADDYGVDSSSLYNTNAGVVLPPTPNIAALAQNGVMFSTAYAYPVCSPTRAAILTGQYGFRTGVGDVIENSSALPTTLWTLPRALTNAGTGYAMAQLGKWHLGGALNGPRNVGGWTNFSGSLPGAITSYTNWTKNVNGVNTVGYTNYATTDVVDDAMAWITAREANHWFAWVAFNAPHTPLHKPPTNLAPTYASLPGTTPHINNKSGVVLRRDGGGDGHGDWPAAYCGESVRHLRHLRRRQRTPGNVLQPPYTSGHGKGSLYEDGIKVPLVVAGGPVTTPGQTNPTRVHVVDLFATILELAGTSASAAVPASVILDSRSFASALTGTTDASRLVYDEQFGTPPGANDGRSLRDARYKLIQFNDGDDEFYDLLTDPTELTNLNAVLTTEQRQHRDRLQFWMYGYTTNTGVTVTAPVLSAGQFSCTVEQLGSYALWRCDDLTTQFWSPVSTAIATTNATMVILTDPAASAERAFYNVVK